MMRPFAATLLLAVPVAALVLATGCSDKAALDGGDDTGPAANDTGLEDSGSWDDTADAGPSLVYFSVDGTVSIAAGEAEADSDTLAIRFWSTSLVPEDGCAGSADVTALTTTALDDDELPIYTWWQVALDTTTDGSCGVDYPEPLFLGIGVLDPLLYPAMEAHDIATEQATLYALYTRYDTNPLFVFGLAGTAENYAGTADPVALAPLPDGTYTLQTLHLLPLPTPGG